MNFYRKNITHSIYLHELSTIKYERKVSLVGSRHIGLDYVVLFLKKQLSLLVIICDLFNCICLSKLIK